MTMTGGGTQDQDWVKTWSSPRQDWINTGWGNLSCFNRSTISWPNWGSWVLTAPTLRKMMACFSGSVQALTDSALTFRTWSQYQLCCTSPLCLGTETQDVLEGSFFFALQQPRWCPSFTSCVETWRNVNACRKPPGQGFQSGAAQLSIAQPMSPSSPAHSPLLLEYPAAPLPPSYLTSPPLYQYSHFPLSHTVLRLLFGSVKLEWSKPCSVSSHHSHKETWPCLLNGFHCFSFPPSPVHHSTLGLIYFLYCNNSFVLVTLNSSSKDLSGCCSLSL